MKICIRCKTEKPFEEFHKNKRSIDGYTTYCKPCKSDYAKRNTYERTTDSKKCAMCGITKESTDFHSHKTSTDGLQGCCKLCQHEKTKKYYEKGGIDIFLKKIFKYLKRNAEIRKIPVEITEEYLRYLYKTQNGKCALSGIEMTYDSYVTHSNRVKNIHNISPDRIDSKKGYIEGNVQLVCNIVNIMKWDFSQEDFVNMCSKIISYNKI